MPALMRILTQVANFIRQIARVFLFLPPIYKISVKEAR